MKIALAPGYVHAGFEAQSTGKVAFNRVVRIGKHYAASRTNLP